MRFCIYVCNVGFESMINWGKPNTHTHTHYALKHSETTNKTFVSYLLCFDYTLDALYARMYVSMCVFHSSSFFRNVVTHVFLVLESEGCRTHTMHSILKIVRAKHQTEKLNYMDQFGSECLHVKIKIISSEQSAHLDRF